MIDHKTPTDDIKQRLEYLLGHHEYDALEKEIFSLVEQFPDWLYGWQMLTDIYLEQGKDARLPALRVLNSAPENPDSLYKYALSLKNAGDFTGAITTFNKVTKIKADNALAYNSMGVICNEIGNTKESIAYYEKALALKPDYRECYSNLLCALSNLTEISSKKLFEKYCDYAKSFELPLRTVWQRHTNNVDKKKNLRIGFVSADFREHAIAYFIGPILSQLSLSPELSLYAYSNSSLVDNETPNVRRKFRHWQQVDHMTDAELASRVREDKIDILVDLSGHTSGNRLLTFAMKPAPVQVSWLGNLYSTGLSSMDYYFADNYLAPVGQFDHQFTEKIVRLPSCTVFTPSQIAPEVNDLPATKNGFITFGCFNRPNKINELTVKIWAALMHAVKNSKLLLGGMPTDGSYDAIIQWFRVEGIHLDRLIFHPRSFMKHYLTLHHQVDICLDTLPSNGFTTTCHAAWMGVPTLCIEGDRTTSRSAMTIMRHIGLHDFVASNEEQFVKIGQMLSADLKQLSQTRIGLRERFSSSPLAQPEQIASSLKVAFRSIWDSWCDGQEPMAFEVSQESLAEQNPNDIIYVTQPNLPKLTDFIPYLERIWTNKTLTNGGPYHQQLEKALCEYLGVKHIALFANGTLALLTALQSLRITGEVITTPYSFVATSHSLLWNGITPVFVDIDPETLNMDPAKIEAAITPKTSAIMPVHCYGHPCDVDAIQTIADNYNLKVIYDAAHAFGVQHQNQSLLKFGDLSVLSFHATKVFNTFEGGAIVCPDAKTKQRIDHLKNFGFVDEVTVVASGINGKMSEVNAAFGLLQLKSIDQALIKRSRIDAHYRRLIAPIQGIECVITAGENQANYSYFPILVKEDYPLSRDDLYSKLKDAGIYARRYFYPLISSFPMYRNLSSSSSSNLPVASQIATEVICLPIFPDLALEKVEFIVSLLSQKS